jgi:hypothetical protein
VYVFLPEISRLSKSSYLDPRKGLGIMRHSHAKNIHVWNQPCDLDAFHFVLDSISFSAIFKSVI